MAIRVRKPIGAVLAALTISAVFVSPALALPFNTDMAGGQNLPAGSMMRSAPAGSVPIGAASRRFFSREEYNKLTNPNPGDAASIKNGQRLFAINCSPCHGKYQDGYGAFSKGKVTELPAPELTDKMYLTDTARAAKPDGFIYGYIHLGGAMMPAYGWKFSPQETWDIINYVRKLQSSRAP
jgi:mono/diheme cytochrome c family protein